MKKAVVRIILAAALTVALALSLASCDMLPEPILELLGEKKECAHAEVEWVVDTPANCKVAGVQHSECKDCGAVIESNVKIDKNDEHALGDWEVDYEPNCSRAGLRRAYLCFGCCNSTRLRKHGSYRG